MLYGAFTTRERAIFLFLDHCQVVACRSLLFKVGVLSIQD